MFHFKYRFLLTITVVFALGFALTGCGSSAPSVEDEAVTDTGTSEQQVAEQPAQDQTAQTQNADTTAEAPVEQPKDQPVEQQNQQPAEPQQAATPDQLQHEVDQMKAENIQLQEKLTVSEQANKDLATKVSDIEAALAASKSAKKDEKTSHYAASVESRPSMPGKSSVAEIKAYTGAVNIAKSRRYSDAINEFQTLLNTGVKDDYADNCHYWIGECNFQMKNYKEALNQFAKVQTYKFSEKKDDAQLMIAKTYERMGNKEKATAEYKKLVEMYPTSEYVARAKSKIK